MLIRAYTDIGKRNENQDSYYAAKFTVDLNGNQEEGLIAVVCDGMGGLAHGKAASSAVVAGIKDFLAVGQFSIDGLKQVLYSVNNVIYRSMEEAKTKSGTTITALILIAGKYRLLHAGDSRCYRIGKDNVFRKLNAEHTAFTKFIHNGELKVVNNKPIFRGNEIPESRVRKMRSTLTNALGVMEAPSIDDTEGEYVEGDVFLLASDGFWHSLEREQGWALTLRQSFSGNDEGRRTEAYAAYLATKFKNAGETDNLTTVMVKA